jgi:GTP cyclohydrolase IA
MAAVNPNAQTTAHSLDTRDIRDMSRDIDITPEQAVRVLLKQIGEDPNRDGLRDTPARVVCALREMTVGYDQDPAKILSRTFSENHDEMIILRGITFHSLCEHHLLTFTGSVAVAYIPGKVVGVSKLARLVECYARRLQIQERMTQQIAQAVQEHLGAVGVGVVVKAHHLCMGCRGVRQPEAEMITSCMLGALREQPETRAELLSLI